MTGNILKLGSSRGPFRHQSLASALYYIAGLRRYNFYNIGVHDKLALVVVISFFLLAPSSFDESPFVGASLEVHASGVANVCVDSLALFLIVFFFTLAHLVVVGPPTVPFFLLARAGNTHVRLVDVGVGSGIVLVNVGDKLVVFFSSFSAFYALSCLALVVVSLLLEVRVSGLANVGADALVLFVFVFCFAFFASIST